MKTAIVVASLGFAAATVRAETPAESHRVTGTADELSPVLKTSWSSLTLSPTARLETQVGTTSSYEVDAAGSESDSDVEVRPRARLGLALGLRSKRTPWSLGGVYEHDVVTGVTDAGYSLDGVGFPDEEGLDQKLRKAYAVVSYKNIAHLGAGFMTSHWGLGLVANDGAHGWSPGNGQFSDPRDGDRVLRGFLAVGLNERLGLSATFAADSVVDDDVLLAHDDAQQLGFGLKAGQGMDHGGGIYAVYRNQKSDNGTHLRVAAVDLHGRTLHHVGELALGFEAEAVLITGETSYGPTMDYPSHDVLQLAVAARATANHGRVSVIVDGVYASGDRNFDDREQNGFKADQNYDMGFLLFPQVLASHTARAVGTAGDLELVGRPSEDLDRFPTRGSVSNTIAAFPKLSLRVIDGLEFYGGPLLAVTAVDSADPLNSRVAGGTPMNALNAAPGRYLGTEFDAGVRYRALFHGSLLTLGLEGGAFKPGSAFKSEDGDVLGSVFGARAMLSYEL